MTSTASTGTPVDRLTITPIRDDIAFGARIAGVTRESLDDAGVRQAITDAFERYGVLVFEDVEPSPAMQVALSKVFGPLKDHPSKAVTRAGDGDDMLGVIEMRHNADEGGVVRLGGRELSSWLPWHFDHCYNDELNRAGVLRCVEGPGDEGFTRFVDGIALYNAISPETRARVEGETVIYAMDVIMGNLRYGRPDDFTQLREAASSLDVMTEFAGRPRALHPAVWTRATGEKVLHVSPWMAKGIEGRDDAEADALLHEISDEIVEVAERLCYVHQWRPTDMVIWDNWRVLHSVSGMDPHGTRTMHRTTIKGDYGLGRFETTSV